VVAAGSMLVIAADVVQAPNDKQQLEPMLGKIVELPDALGEVGGQRIFQRGQCERLRRGRDRSGDRNGARSASSLARRTLRERAAAA
jgi:hypothetical protein